MKRALLILLLSGACQAPPSQPADWSVSLSAAGPIRFGTQPAEAARALGATLADSFPNPGCAYWRAPGAPGGMSFMVENGRIVRVDIDSAGVSEIHGLSVGSSVSAVRAAFPSNLTIQPHPYSWEAGWKYFIVFAADSSSALLFEADSQTVRSYRSGLWPQVGYKERCG